MIQVPFLDFSEYRRDDLHLCVATVGHFPEPMWPGLFQPWEDDRIRNPYFRWAINNNDGEAVAVWRALAWALTAGFDRYAIPNYYQDDAARLLGREPVPIRWEWDAEEDDFVPGRPAPAGLFRLHTFDDLTAVAQAVGVDATSEITMFGTSGDRLAEKLNPPGRPRLADVLRPADIFVDLAVVHDLISRESRLTVAATHPIAARVQELAAHYRGAYDRYLGQVPELYRFEQFEAAVEGLLAVPG